MCRVDPAAVTCTQILSLKPLPRTPPKLSLDLHQQNGALKCVYLFTKVKSADHSVVFFYFNITEKSHPLPIGRSSLLRGK